MLMVVLKAIATVILISFIGYDAFDWQFHVLVACIYILIAETVIEPLEINFGKNKKNI